MVNVYDYTEELFNRTGEYDLTIKRKTGDCSYYETLNVWAYDELDWSNTEFDVTAEAHDMPYGDLRYPIRQVDRCYNFQNVTSPYVARKWAETIFCDKNGYGKAEAMEKKLAAENGIIRFLEIRPEAIDYERTPKELLLLGVVVLEYSESVYNVYAKVHLFDRTMKSKHVDPKRVSRTVKNKLHEYNKSWKI